MNLDSQIAYALEVFDNTLDDGGWSPTLNPYFRSKIALAYARTLKRHFLENQEYHELDEYFDVLEDELKKEFY